MADPFASWPTRPATLAEVLLGQAARHPDRRGFVFHSAPGADSSLTYGELLRHAQAIGAALQRAGEAGERALLLYPPGLDFVAALCGCLVGGVIAVPAYPPDPARLARTLPRLQAIAADAQVTCVLTTAAIRALAATLFDVAPELLALRWLATDDLDLAAASQWQTPTLTADSIAWLQYTSGSTAEPKGVMVSHRNVLHNSAAIFDLAQHTEDSVYVCWLPSYHDMGLIGGIIQPLYGGFLGVLMSPVAFLQSPVEWLRAMTRYGGTTTPFPNFALDLCVRKITAEQRRRLDLSRWQVACNGAEPIRWESLERFSQAFAPYGFRAEAHCPAYGLAEATLLVTATSKAESAFSVVVSRSALAIGQVVVSSPDTADAQRLVSCGRSLPDQELLIVDRERLLPCPPDQVGEIWLRGPSVARGYWRKREETDQTFHAHLQSGAGPFLRTGDLGFLKDGELIITGRCKDLIIVRGRNLYPQDLERSAERAHPQLRPGCIVAFSVEVGGEEQLVLAAELDPRRGPVDADAIWAALQETIAKEHQISLSAALLLEPGALPKTSSGKLQRHACRAGFLAGTLRVLQRCPVSREVVHTVVQTNLPADAVASAGRADTVLVALRELATHRYNAMLADERRTLPPAVVMELGRLGVLGLQAPQAAGGLALRTLDMLRVIEQLGAIDLTLATFVGMHNALGLGPVLRHARPALRDELVPLLASGRGIGAFAFSEPQAGSNVRALAALAQPAGDGRWTLHGRKMWIGSASWATSLNVFVRSPGTDGYPPGVHAFVVPQGVKGLRIGDELMTMGLRAMVQNELFFDGVLVDQSRLLGTPGAGMSVANEAFNQGRLGIVAMCTGAMKRAARLGLRYAQRRTVQSGRLLDAPLTLVRLAELTASIGALDALWQLVAQRIDEQREVPDELYAVCKIVAPDLACEGIDGVMQLLGGRGYLEPDELPRMLRDARVFRIGEGPTEVLNLFLGSRLLHHGKFLAFLDQQLGAADIAASLAEVAQVLSERKATPAGLRYALLGELTAAGTLFAITRQAEQASPGHNAAAQLTVRERARATAWSQARFVARRAAILGERARAADGLSAREVEAWVDRAAQGVGDVEPGAAGAAWDMDPWLRRAVAAERPTPVAVERMPPPSAPTPDAHIRTVARAWLAERLALPESMIADDTPLTQLGLDSVLAVELAHRLEQVLGRPVDPGAAWAFPTLDALARGLSVGRPTTARLNLHRRDSSVVSALWASERAAVLAEPTRAAARTLQPVRAAPHQHRTRRGAAAPQLCHPYRAPPELSHRLRRSRGSAAALYCGRGRGADCPASAPRAGAGRGNTPDPGRLRCRAAPPLRARSAATARRHTARFR